MHDGTFKVALITGTREMVSDRALSKLRDACAWADLVIIGDCPTGVDAKVAEHWGAGKLQLFTADWEKLGKRAGPERNGRMVARAVELRESRSARVVCFAFPSRRSKGTWDCLKQAVNAGIPARLWPA